MCFNVAWKSDSAIMFDFVTPELEQVMCCPNTLWQQGFRAELGNFTSHNTFSMQMKFLKCKTLDTFRSNSYNDVLVRSLSASQMSPASSMFSAPTQYVQSPRVLPA